MPITLELFKKFSEEQIAVYGDSIPLGIVYDANGCVLTYKDSEGNYRIKDICVSKQEFEEYFKLVDWYEAGVEEITSHSSKDPAVGVLEVNA